MATDRPGRKKKFNWSKKLTKHKIFGQTIYQKVFRIYFFTVFIGAILLSTPAATRTRQISFFDALFTAISAFTNTGLTVNNTYETFSFFGQLVLAVLIEIGGIGFLTLVVVFWTWLRSRHNKKMYPAHARILHLERGSHEKVESTETVKTALWVLITVEIISAYLLTMFFYTVGPNIKDSVVKEQTYAIANPQGKFWKSLWCGIFHAVSAANNAGFDILGKFSIIPYRNGIGNFLSGVLMVESIAGGLGYPIFHELKIYLQNKKKGLRTNFSLSFKLGLLSYFVIALFGAVLAVIFEIVGGKAGVGLLANPLNTQTDFEWSSTTSRIDKVWNIIYLTFSSRSSGFASIATSDLTEATRWLITVLMFIGANPVSTGGGIRTITVFVICARFLYTARGWKHLSIFKKTIPPSTVHEAAQIFVLSVILLIVSTFIMMPSSSTGSMRDAIFEASSAFGTAGLTSGFTQHSSWVGKMMLIVLMFVGQLGVSNALISITDLQSNKDKDREYSSARLRLM